MSEVEKRLKSSYSKTANDIFFSKDEDNDLQAVEIMRQYFATKYVTSLKHYDEETASLSRTELENVAELVDGKDRIDNYKQYFKISKLKSKNVPGECKCGLKNVDEALKIVASLPCQRSNVEPCKNKNYLNRCIEKCTNQWKNDKNHSKLRNAPKPSPSSFDSSSNVRSRPQFACQVPAGNPGKSNSFQPPPKTSQNAFFQPKIPSQQPKVISNLQPRQGNGFKEENEPPKPKVNGFKSARDELNLQLAKKNKQLPQKKTLGGKRSVDGQYVNPFKKEDEKNQDAYGNSHNANQEEPEDERLKGIDPKMIELIKNEIMDTGMKITWDDIAGLEYPKKIIKEIVVLPMLRPDIFSGLRRPPKGILLFGPPGTGKTLIGKCIASQIKSTFFSISASSLTSKWIGEGEKMVRALFAVARVYQPSVIFIDEIDSLLTQRSETEHESSRRIKTEFLVQLDGAATAEEDRILIVGATNRPYELDEAARRRLVKRLYIPLPEHEARGQIVVNLLRSERHNLTSEDVDEISRLTDGYSGADMANLCKEASMGPIRSIPFNQLENIDLTQVGNVTMKDFRDAIKCVRPSVSQKDLTVYLDWNKTYGTGTNTSIA